MPPFTSLYSGLQPVFQPQVTALLSGLTALRMLSATGLNVVDWRLISNHMWDGKTVQQACDELGLDYKLVMLDVTEEMKGFLLDVSMLANYRDEELL